MAKSRPQISTSREACTLAQPEVTTDTPSAAHRRPSGSQRQRAIAGVIRSLGVNDIAKSSRAKRRVPAQANTPQSRNAIMIANRMRSTRSRRRGARGMAVRGCEISEPITPTPRSVINQPASAALIKAGCVDGGAIVKPRLCAAPGGQGRGAWKYHGE